MSDTFKFGLGDHVVDIVTKFEGIVTGRAEHITNCNTYGVQPALKENKYESPSWFDEPRLQLTGQPRIALPSAVPEPTAYQKTGAGENPQTTRTVG